MKQKWISILVCALILMLSFSFPASAVSDGFESIQDAEEYSEILALQDDILTQINNIAPLERPNQTIVFTEEDMDWSKAYKLYIDTNIYDLENPSIEEIQQTLKDSSAIWQLPVSKNGLHFLIGIAKSGPLPNDADSYMTEEEQQRVREKEGKWTCNTIATPEMPTSYRVQFESILEQNGIADSPVKILLGGMEKMRSVSGIALNNETILGVVPLEEPRLMGVPQPATRSTLPIIETNHLYSFDEIAQVIQATTVPSTNGATGGGGEIYEPPAPNYTILLILTAVCGAVIAALCLYGRYSSKA